MKVEFDRTAADFLHRALSEGYQAGLVVEDPEGIASKLGIELGEDTVEAIRALGSASVQDKLRGLSQPARDFFRKAVTDGRFLSEWPAEPELAAERLGLSVDSEIMDELLSMDLDETLGVMLEPEAVPVSAIGIVVIPLAVGLAMTASAEAGGHGTVSDHSGKDKY